MEIDLKGIASSIAIQREIKREKSGSEPGTWQAEDYEQARNNELILLTILKALCGGDSFMAEKLIKENS